MEEIIIAALLADATVAGLVGSRVYPSKRKQGENQFPVIVLQTISFEKDLLLAGVSGFNSGRMQLDIWGLKYKQVKLVSRAVRNLLHGQSFGGIQLVTVSGDRDGVDRQNDTTDLFRVTQELEIKHCE